MSNTIDDRLMRFVSKAIHASLIAQHLRTQGIDVATLDEGDPAFAAARTVIDAQGYDPTEVGRHILAALVYIFCHPENVPQLVDVFANVIWFTLGDPKSGAPPVLYKKAALHIHAAVIGILDPNLLTPCNSQQ